MVLQIESKLVDEKFTTSMLVLKFSTVNSSFKTNIYLQTGGTSAIGDQPVTGKYIETPGRIFSDKENIYAYPPAFKKAVSAMQYHHKKCSKYP